MRIGNSAPHAASNAAQGLAQAQEALKQKAEPGPKASAQLAPAAVAHISDKGASKAAADAQVEKATREAAAQNGPNSAQNAAKAAGLLRAQLAQATA